MDTFNNNGSYNKTNWTSGDRITSDNLNKIEDALYQINENYVTESYVDNALGDIAAILDAINGEEV